MNSIDISTEEKKKNVLEIFESFEKKGDIHSYFNIPDNKIGISYINDIAEKIGFDFSFYKKKKKKYCLNCGKELKRGQTKFCSSSCAATYNNKGRKHSDETKEKIKTKLKKRKNKRIIQEKIKVKKYCLNCDKELNGNQTKFCSNSCSSKYKHKISYERFLENNEQYCNGGYTPKSFKDFFLKEQNYECAIEGCTCKPEWNGKPLVFVLDHIDGNAANNRRDNLRMICPNCDTQLETFKSKNKNSTRRNYWKEKIIKNIKES